MTMFECKSDISLEDVCSNLQTEYDLPSFVFDEHNTWEYAISKREGIRFNVTKTEKLDTLTTWVTAIPDNVNYQIIVNITSAEYSSRNIKKFLERISMADVIEM